MKIINKLGLLGFIFGCTTVIAATILENAGLFIFGWVLTFGSGFVFICDWE